MKISKNFLFVTFFIFTSLKSIAATYTMGTSGSQSATVTATSGTPDKFYDNGGSASNYSASITSVTYTFNCAAGKYIRIKFNTLVTESSFDYLYVYDGTTTSDRLIGEASFSGTAPGAYMYVATSGSLTVKFTSDGTTQYAGWNADVWIDNYPGQIWNGATSTESSTASNWEGGVLPYNGYTSIYIPSGLTNYPEVTGTSTSLTIYDLRIASGGTLLFSSSVTGHNISIYGNMIVDGTFTKTSTFYVNFEGGTSSRFASISGTGDLTTVSVSVGLNRTAYYKLLNSVLIKSFKLQNVIGSSMFDMNYFDMRVNDFIVSSTTTFYHRTGLLRIEIASATIDDIAFNEETGTTYFSKGEYFTVGNQTIPSVTYYNLKVRTNSGFVATLGNTAAFTVTNDLTFLNPSTAGGSATTAFDITCNGNVYVGNTDNALTLNLANRIARSTALGTGTFTMGNNNSHVINVTYAHATNWAISLGSSGATSNLTFYGTVNYNSASAQKVMASSYRDLTILGAGSRSLSAATTVTNNLTISAGTLTAGSAYDLSVGGTWSNNSVFTHTNGTVFMNGSSNQSIAGTATTTFYNLTNSNSSTGLTLNRGIMVTNNLTMSGATANILLNGFNIDLSSTGTIVGESNTDRIYGTSGVITTTRNLSNISGLNIAGMGIVLTTASNMGSTTIQRGHSASSGTGLTNATILRYFSVSPTTNSGLNATFQFNYFDNELNGLSSSEPNFKMFRSTDGGTSWTNRSGVETTASNYITLVNIDAFSIWTVSPDLIITLPISLVEFSGFKEGVRENKLIWTTVTEDNNDFFTLERSENGVDYSVVGIIDGAGKSDQIENYSFIDKDFNNDINYYRLKQTDFDGKYTYSTLIAIDNREGKATKEIVKIFNILGQEVDQEYRGAVIIVYSDNTILRTYRN